MSRKTAIRYLALETWAGRRLHPVEVIGENATTARVRIKTAGGVMLPGRRWAACGDVVQVPKYAILDLQAPNGGSHPNPTPDPS